MKPTVFIGSSKEGIEVARAIRTQLDEVAEITIWNEGGVFQLGHGYLEALVNALPGFDFAILVLSADDSIESRGVTSLAPRDNVMFELGLFMGRLGRERTFAICDELQKVKLASDLASVSLAGYRSRQDGNLVAAVGVATDRIRGVIKSLGIHEARASQQLQQATSSIETASGTVNRLVNLLARSRAVELEIISSQFGGFIQTDLLDKMKIDLKDLEQSTNIESPPPTDG
jgi:Predicted nucleotide-binding protein containing TIR-like domain